MRNIVRQAKIFIKRLQDDKSITRQQRFTEIYKNNLWGQGNEQDEFYSGEGSDLENAKDYITAVVDFVIENKCHKLIDIGCGDFRVSGAILQQLTARNHRFSYLGYDLVEDLVAYNQDHFGTENIKFRVGDIVEQQIEQADVIFVREVLQHLSNRSIKAIVDKCLKTATYTLVTNVQPKNLWKKNVDYIEGASARLKYKTGIYLDAEPFNIPVKHLLTSDHLNTGTSVLNTVVISRFC